MILHFISLLQTRLSRSISFILPFAAIYMATWPAVWIKVYGAHRLEFALSVFTCSLGIAMLVSKPFAGKRSKSMDATSKKNNKKTDKQIKTSKM